MNTDVRWRYVPVEPTKEMLAAGKRIAGKRISSEWLEVIWNAMCCSATQPPMLPSMGSFWMKREHRATEEQR